MARRRLTLALEPVLAGALAAAPVGGAPIDDSGDEGDREVPAGGPHARRSAADAVLDAAEAFLREHGLHCWSVEDVAERAGVGRTSVYRRFPSRDDLVHAVLARELRLAIVAVGTAASGAYRLDDAVVDAVLAALDALDGSVVDALVHSDPADVLPLLTTGAGPLITQARDAFAPGLVALGVARERSDAEVAAEALARLGLSFVLTRDTVLPLEDPGALRAAVRSLIELAMPRLQICR